MAVTVGVTVTEACVEAEGAGGEGVPQLQHMPPPAHQARGSGKRGVIDSGAKTTSRQGPSGRGCLAEQ